MINMKKQKIMLYGIGSLRNKGCEALVLSSINQFPNNSEIVLASFDYQNDKNKYKEKISKIVDHHKHDETKFSEKDKKAFIELQNKPWNTYDYECFYERDVIKEMKDADLCIHIGGDNYCYGVNEWIYAATKTSKSLGKKTVLWGASLYDDIIDLSLIEDLKRYDLLILREKISYNAIKKYIPEEKLVLMPDPAFSLKQKKVTLNKWYNERDNIIGINLSPLTIKTEENEKAIDNLIRYILNKTNYSIALIPHVTVDEANDLTVLEKIKDKYKNEKRIYLDKKEYNSQEIKSIIGKCDLLIASRTHASIAAYSQCIPTLVIGYSVKSRGIAEMIFGNYKDYVLTMDELIGNKLVEKFKKINNNKDNIKKTLETKMKNIKKESSSMYKKMMEKLEYLDQKYICSNEKCTGCMACYNNCPVGAIEIIQNKEGFSYPKINLKKCIHCNKCRKTCPILSSNNKNNINKKTICYGAKSKDEKIKIQSTSGGVFSHFANHILENGGIVYGDNMKKFKVSHIRIDNIKDISKIRGSKYSQSDIKDIYKNVKKDLDDNKNVLFSGTPCQILGLKKYLNKQYKNLLLISVICHGVINNKILNKRIKEIENKYDTKMKKVTFRSKVNGWDPAKIEYNTERIDKSFHLLEDPMMYLYIKDFILRESCYNCPAKGNNNPADVILGDFWGIYSFNEEFYDKNGVSAIILNTSKGWSEFNKIKNNLHIIETDYEQILKHNPSLNTSSKRDIYRNKIFNDLETSNFDIIAENCKYKLEDEKDKTIQALKEEINSIYSSKRYRIANKVGNIINKINIRRK